jgi:hypothetical protein
MKLLDAMRWYIVHDEHDPAPQLSKAARLDYMKLRSQWKLEVLTDKIRIHKTAEHTVKRPFDIKSYAAEAVAEQHTATTTWRQEFMDYLQNAPSGDQPFIRDIPVFTEDDRTYMKNICLQTDVGWAYENGRLTVVK